ncbi:MAG TPA: family 10 glycosylhydrolase [Armatimonadota bacterium]|nr:family 10 glycosylhydrolase [Armatimonadota bacterium]
MNGTIYALLAAGMCLGTRSVAQEGTPVRFISDMSQCRPAKALSEDARQGRWRLLPYETDEVSGTMIGAASFIDAPDVTLPVDADGWHAVYIGYWNPYYAYDGGTVVKVRLSDAPCFRRFREGNSSRSQTETAIREVYVDAADLTGQDIVLGKAGGPIGQKAYIAYIKLVPLSDEEIAEIQADRADTATRRLTATIDGMSYFHHSECATPEHVMELVEPYRHSDVGKVLWAVNYGDRTNYPSEVGTFVGGDDSRASLHEGAGTNPYIIGEKAMWSGLRSLAAKGEIPQKIAADHAHGMGLEFDIMFRLGIGGGIPPNPHAGPDAFTTRHPEFRQVQRDGTVVEKASYAFPEVREFMLSLVREAAGQFDVDGINLCFARGPHFISYEEPIAEEFRQEYGEEATEVATDDPRLMAIRARHMTEFVEGARRVLDEVGEAKGKRLNLSIWAWPSEWKVWCGGTPMEDGLDIKTWIAAGLLDSVVCQQGIDEEYLALGKEHGCEFVLFTGYRGDLAMSPATISAAYEAGVEQVAYWDMDCAQDVPEVWEWLKRSGHGDEMATWDDHAPTHRYIRLNTVGGYDVRGGLQQSVYSGG